MTGCSDPDCKENLKDNINGLKKTVYGEDGTQGLVGHVREKISRKAVSVFALAIIGSVTMVTVSGLTAWGNSQEKIHKTRESVRVLEQELKGIAKGQEEIKAQIEAIHDRQLNQKDLLREIRKLLHERNGRGNR